MRIDMDQDNQLDVPDTALHDSKSFEILRVWIANGGQHVSLRAGVWDDPAAWGLMLADLVRHIVNTYETGTASDRERVLERIRLGLAAELENPTDEPTQQ